ncbi:MAG TPA: GNAT family protein [Anaerolineae bacterium]|nr:GNAT family protein [Anaerolineae bacterium]HNU05581.1 GNAT family protein [Anaerolineae bacterium]
MIYADGIRLRAVEREDIPTFVRWFNDPEVRRTLLMFAPMSKVSEERWFESRQTRDNDYLFGIEVPVNDDWQLIGNVGLHQIDWVHRHCTFGIVIGERTFWERGYGSKATRAALRFAFHTLNLHRVELEVFDFNQRARHVYEKAGFRLEGTRRQALFQDGVYHDEHLMAILRTEFE